jgi:hypothetical protein
MDIKNFAVNLCSGRAKIIVAVFACLTIVLAIAIFYSVNERTSVNALSYEYDKCVAKYGVGCSANSYTCGYGSDINAPQDNLGYHCHGANNRWEYDKPNENCKCKTEPCNYTFYNRDGTVNTGIGKASSGCKELNKTTIMPAESVALAQQNQDLTSAQNVADGGACPCGLTHTVICSASAPSANGGYCKNGNCVDGKCKLLECAISDSDGKVIARIGEGVKTCTKPRFCRATAFMFAGKILRNPRIYIQATDRCLPKKNPLPARLFIT